MTTVGFAESSRYAFRLYAYVLAVFVVGAVGVGLGVALLWPEVRAWRGPGRAAIAPGVAGGILVFLGASVLTVGWLGTTYKLLADGVAAGHEGGREHQPTGRETADSPATPDRGTDGSSEQPPDDEQPPEPSPAEIAFGTEDDAGARTDGPLPGGDGAGDPLGERSK